MQAPVAYTGKQVLEPQGHRSEGPVRRYLVQDNQIKHQDRQIRIAQRQRGAVAKSILGERGLPSYFTRLLSPTRSCHQGE